MEAALSQKELLKLSQKNTAGSEFLEAAARYLRYDLVTTHETIFERHGGKTIRKSLTPREDFVLRLLLKRFSTSHEVLKTEFWTLFGHLINIVPIKTLARQLDELEFLKSLPHVLEKVGAISVDNHDDSGTESLPNLESGRPAKKRRLAAADHVHQPALSKDLLYPLVCQVIANLMHLTEDDADVNRILRSVLSAASEHAATIAGKLLQLLEPFIYSQERERESELQDSIIPRLLAVWENRRPESSDGKVSRDQHFTAHCLRPALRLLCKIKNSPQESSFANDRSFLERLIALHSVLPLRSIFMTKKSQEWKSKTSAIGWNDFEQLYSVVGMMLFKSIPTATARLSNEKAAGILYFFDIAARSVPRSTMRILQREQAWLDCLFCVSACLSSPDLPRIISDNDGHWRIQESSEIRPSKRSRPHLEALFARASEEGIKLSLQVLLYFTIAVVECEIDDFTWPLMARIMEQDSTVLVPNSGLFGTSALLEKICDAISSVINTSLEGYSTILDGFLRPLMRGFSQARDLKGFLLLWIRGLEDSIQQRTSGDHQYGQTCPVLVWEDDNMFRDFEGFVKALPTMTLSQSVMVDTLALLQEASTRVGPTSDILSHVAIASSLLKVQAEDVDSDTVQNTISSTVQALSRRSDFQQQRWRFWKLLRLCYSTLGCRTEGVDPLLQKLDDQDVQVSLRTMRSSNTHAQGFAQEAILREALECFHLTVLRSMNRQSDDKSQLEREILQLIESFSARGQERNDSLNEGAQRTSFDLPLLCVAKLLQCPDILKHFYSHIPRLIAAMSRPLHISSKTGSNTNLLESIKALLLTEEVSSNSTVLSNCCSELLDLKGANRELPAAIRNILTLLPLNTIKKPLLESLADSLLLRVRSDFDIASSEEILADLGLLEMIIDAAAVSIGKTKKWEDFVSLADHVLNRIRQPTTISHQIAVGCLSNMLGIVRKRSESSNSANDVIAGTSRLRSQLDNFQRPPDEESPRDVEDGCQSTTELMNLRRLNNADLAQLASHISNQALSLGSGRAEMLMKLLKQPELHSGEFLLLSAIVYQITASEEGSDLILHQSLSRIADLQFALKAATAVDLSLALETCSLVLDRYPSIINQHTTDTLLTSLTALACPTSTTTISTATCPSAIFNRLCAILGLVLSRHRKRFGGRYHLLIPTLQSLLACLFFAGTASQTPAQTKAQVLFVRTLPRWLRNSSTPLPPSSATSFTRVLTTLAEPSISSVRHRQSKLKSNELTDATKKEKSLAGQHLQYLIMSYSVNSLRGRLASETKEKLMPGLYAVLDVMDREVMRGMNGAMDASARAIFKDLYADYVRFGRWDRK